MDQATQQNAALVEQMAAAASSLNSQAGELVQAVSVFNLDADSGMVKTTVRAVPPRNTPFKGGERRAIASAHAVPKPAAGKTPLAKPVSLPKPVATAKAPADAGGADDWETF
jgi:methyl-accepting chemotaxis protein